MAKRPHYTVSETPQNPKIIRGSTVSRMELEELSIFYDDKPMPLEEFFGLLKSTRSRMKNIPDSLKLFTKFTKETLAFTLDDIQWNKKQFSVLYENEREAIQTIEDTQSELIKYVDKRIEEQGSAMIEKSLFTRLLFSWFENAFEFLTETKDVLQKLNTEPMALDPATSTSHNATDTEVLGETVFTQLFMKFTQMFFLKPEVGENDTKILKVRQNVVGAIPDVCYYERSIEGRWRNILVMLTEVNKYAMVESSQDNEEIWIAGRLKDEVLGQIGSQLVVNSRTSSFAPCTLGIVCMSTEIIFMFLDMKAGHYDAIQADENVTGFHAVIRYTKSYDIMKADDRNQLSEMLFWLGCVQKQSLDKYFLIK